MTSITRMSMGTALMRIDFAFPICLRDHAKRVGGGQNHDKPNSTLKD